MPAKKTDNDLRGVVSAEFGTKKVKLKLTLDGIRRAEILSNSSWQKLIARGIEGDLRIDDMAAVWWAGLFGILGEDAVPPFDEVMDFVLDEGGLNVNRCVRELLFLQAVGRKHTEEYQADMEAAAAEEEAKKKATKS